MKVKDVEWRVRGGTRVRRTGLEFRRRKGEGGEGNVFGGALPGCGQDGPL